METIFPFGIKPTGQSLFPDISCLLSSSLKGKKPEACSQTAAAEFAGTTEGKVTTMNSSLSPQIKSCHPSYGPLAQKDASCTSSTNG